MARLRRPPMTREVPANPESITPDWLTSVLKSTGSLSNGTVKAVEAERLGEGQGFASRIYRLKLAYEGQIAGAPEFLIGKFCQGESDGDGLHTLDTEIRFYSDLGPSSGIRTPRSYYGASDPQAGRSLLLLEDLRDGRIGDTLSGCTKEDAQLAVEYLASFHARWWEAPELEQFPWIPQSPFTRLEESAARTAWTSTRQETWDVFTREFASEIPSSIEQAWDALGERGPQVRSQFLALPMGLCHGDFRLDNLFFSNEGASAPLTVFDWQTIHRGPGLAICDLALFLSSSLEPDPRRELEVPLLQSYSEQLRENGVNGFGPGQCQRGYQLGLYEEFQAFVYVCTCLELTTERARAWITTMLHRLGSALADHPVEDVLR